jgi:thiol-disulfide isomerase/thioredoxin
MLASLSDPSGRSQMMFQWRGKVLVVNFWATSCAPCRDETPASMRIQHQYVSNGVKIVSITIDNVSKVRDFQNEIGMDCVLLFWRHGNFRRNQELGKSRGVLRFTLVLDRGGKIAYVHAGALSEALLGAVLTPLL